MTSSTLVLLSIALGLILGTALTASIFLTRAASRRRAAEMRPELPEIATSILHEMDTFAVILDASLSPVYANPVAQQDQRISGDELGTPEFLTHARMVMSTGVPYTRHPNSDDPTDTLRVHIVRVQPRFIVVLADDLGEEQRVNAMRRDFIANVSHELKTPIAAIGLLAEAVKEASDQPELVRDFAKSLMKESKRLGELSRDVIRLSEAQSTLMPEDREPVLLAALVRDEVEAHREYAGGRAVEIAFTDPDGEAAEASIIGKPAALGVAVANLISNAIKYSPEGGRVGVGTSCSGQQFTITVTDQGPGIEAEHLPRIFERFYRVDGSRSREGGGTGLGLSITRHTVRAHGGDVTVWSQPGQGSTFTITLPVAVAGRNDKKVRKRIKRLKKHREPAKSGSSQEGTAQA
ncbi:sensor histidine kinase [Leucobacter sp. GX24907]